MLNVLDELDEEIRGSEKLKIFTIKNNKFKREEIKRLVELLIVNSSITHLNLSNNEIGDKDALFISRVFRLGKQYTHIDISNNQIGDEGACSIFENIMYTYTTELNLSNNQIGDIGAQCISKLNYWNYDVSLLDLSNNKIGNKGALHIINKLEEKSFTVTKLKLDNNNIRDSLLKEIQFLIDSRKLNE